MSLGNEPKQVLAQLARHYIWLAVRARAGPDVPERLLAEVAHGTAAEVPRDLGPVERVEWHIARICEVARERMTDAAGIITATAAAGLEVMDYPHGALAVSHHISPDAHAEANECATSLPAVICRCGRFLLVAT